MERSSTAEEGCQLTDPDETPDEPAYHRRAQEAVDELARMGIDPVTLGLRPAGTSDADRAPAHGTEASHRPTAPQPGNESAPGVSSDMEPVAPLPAASAAPTPTMSLPWADPTTPMMSPDHMQDFHQSPFQLPVRGRAAPLESDEPDGDTSWTQPTAPVVAPTGVRHAVTAFGTGLFTARSAQRIQDEQHLMARIRTPQREHQVVAFVAGKGGVGATTTAAGVALTVATLRDDQAALIDAQAGTDSLQRWLSDGVASNPPGLADAQDGPTPYPSLRLSNGLDVIDGAPWQAPTAPADLAALIGGLRHDHVFTVVDLGDDVGATAHQTLAASTRVVVVTAADRHAARATRLTLGRIHQVQPARLFDAVVAVVCLERWQYRRVLRELRDDLGSEATQVVPIPHEPALGAMDHLDLSRLRAQSREAYLRVAAALAGPRVPTPVVRPDISASPW